MRLLEHGCIGARQTQNITVRQNHGVIQDILAQGVGLAAGKALPLHQGLLHLFTLQMVVHRFAVRVIVKEHAPIRV